MKFGQLIEYNKRKTFLQKSCRKSSKEANFRPFLFFKKALYEVKASGLQLSFNIFQQSSSQQRNCIEFDNIDPEICSIFNFQKKEWVQLLHHILRMNFQEKYFSCCILLTKQSSFSDCFYFFRCWSICVLKLFVNQVVTSQCFKLTLSF